MKISVYLDTHHLSRMASGQSEIKEFISDEIFLFVFSTSHVVECLPKEPRQNPGAIARLNIILGPQAKWLVGWGKVASLEMSNSAVDLNHLFCGKHQMLFPDYKIDRSEFVIRIRQDLKKMLKAKFEDENKRRSVQAKLLKHGKLTAEAFRIIKQQFQDTVQRVSIDLPQAAPLLDAGGLFDFIEGTISEEDFKEKFLDSLADPVALATMSSIPELSSILDLSRFFWAQMDDLSEVLSKFVINVRSKLAGASAPTNYAKARNEIEQSLKGGGFREAIVRRIAGVEVAAEDLSTMAGTRLFADLFSQYTLEKLDRYANPGSVDFSAVPEFKRSDVADFTHTFYYPYVDIFGCDGAMRDRMRRAGWSTEKVVTTDSELEAKLIEIGRG